MKLLWVASTKSTCTHQLFHIGSDCNYSCCPCFPSWKEALCFLTQLAGLQMLHEWWVPNQLMHTVAILSTKTRVTAVRVGWSGDTFLYVPEEFTWNICSRLKFILQNRKKPSTKTIMHKLRSLDQVYMIVISVWSLTAVLGRWTDIRFGSKFSVAYSWMQQTWVIIWTRGLTLELFVKKIIDQS